MKGYFKKISEAKYYLNNIKKRDDVLLIEVTKENREKTLGELVEIISNMSS